MFLIKRDFNGNVYIHGFTDGRDCSPKSGINAFQKLENYILNTNIQISTIVEDIMQWIGIKDGRELEGLIYYFMQRELWQLIVKLHFKKTIIEE